MRYMCIEYYQINFTTGKDLVIILSNFQTVTVTELKSNLCFTLKTSADTYTERFTLNVCLLLKIN